MFANQTGFNISSPLRLLPPFGGGDVLTIITKGNVVGLPHGLIRPQPLYKVIHVSQPLELFP
jgi:hypothetical protein